MRGIDSPAAAASDLDPLALLQAATFAEGDPHRIWRDLRRSSPVHPVDFEGERYWWLTKYDDVVAVSKDAEAFSSQQGLAMGDGAMGAGQMLIATDPPRHSERRRLVNKPFSASAMTGLRPMVERVVSEVLDSAMSGDSCDFAADVAAPIPVRVICDLLGIPEDYRQALLDRLDVLVDISSQSRGMEQAAAGLAELAGLLATVMAEHDWSDDPRGIGQLVSQANGANSALAPEELPFFLLQLFAAGFETTRNSMAGGVLALAENPGLLDALRDDPAQAVPLCAEEVLRWTTPVIHFVRTATRETVIRDVTIPAGEKVVLWYPSANRDEHVFDEPDTFRPDRQPNPHIAFGVGPHFCLGAHLARLEIRVLLEQLLQRGRGWHVENPPQRSGSNVLGGITQLQLTWGA